MLLRLRRDVARRALIAVAALLAFLPTAVFAEEACLLGRAPPLVPQMLALVALLGQTTGQPLECVRGNPDNGDLLQQTSTGLLIYRTATGAAIFTDGWTHWALVSDGLVTWAGSGLDPPGVTLTAVIGGAPNGGAHVSARTAPGASCSIAVHTPSGSPSRAVGLEPRTADATTGEVRWTWRIGASTRRGEGHVIVACDGAGASAPLRIE